MQFSAKILRKKMADKLWLNEKFIAEVSAACEQQVGQVPDRKTILSWIADDSTFHSPGRYLAVLCELFDCQPQDFYEKQDSAPSL